LPDFINNTDSMFIDVHGNQTQLLAWSKCFIKSNMDCATCHNTHENERGNITLYNERCKTCHTTTEHNLTANGSMQLNKFINNNCVNCHMPTQSSKKIIMQTSGSGSMFSAAAVNHRIAVYSEETNRIMKLFHN
ncbi:MAG: cytochrome c3 family protein, partial [Ginsengibacter sp.]